VKGVDYRYDAGDEIDAPAGSLDSDRFDLLKTEVTEKPKPKGRPKKNA
jgi:hypothetical protein